MEEDKKIKYIKDFKIALKDMEPVVRDPKFLHNGRDIPNFSLRPREAWANWLLCVVLRKINNDDGITFAEDNNGDGIIYDTKTGAWVQTEHVSALEIPLGEKLSKGENRVIDAINKKINRGLDYAKNKYLIVFFDGAGEFFRNKIRENIRGKLGFLSVYAIGLLTSDENGYTYSATEFHDQYSITFKIQINPDFTDWEVSLIK